MSYCGIRFFNVGTRWYLHRFYTDKLISGILAARPEAEPRTSSSASQELIQDTTAAPTQNLKKSASLVEQFGPASKLRTRKMSIMESTP